MATIQELEKEIIKLNTQLLDMKQLNLHLMNKLEDMKKLNSVVPKIEYDKLWESAKILFQKYDDLLNNQKTH